MAIRSVGSASWRHTASPGGNGRRALVALCAVLMACGTARATAGSPAGAPAGQGGTPGPGGTQPRFVVAASVGAARPGDGVARELYGGTGLALRVDAAVPIRGAFSAFVGVRVAGATGETAVVEPRVADEAYPIELRTRTVILGGLITQPLSPRLRWFAGVGLAVGSFEERWPALGPAATGTSLGGAGVGGVCYDVSGRFSLVARADLLVAPARLEAGDGRKPDLGGLDFSLGAAVRF